MSIIGLLKLNDVMSLSKKSETCAYASARGLRPHRSASGTKDNDELQVVLCFSPVGATLRVRARKFPSLVNCTAINWFHEWPREALRSVSKRFLSEVESLPVSYNSYKL